MTKQKVPINAKVLAWAVQESGISPVEVVQKVGTTEAVFEDWLAGTDMPGVTQFRKLAIVLKRPSATLLLPSPPRTAIPKVEFRHPPERQGRPLNPQERFRLREAGRLQRGLRWILADLHEQPPQLPKTHVSSNAEAVAGRVRTMLGVAAEIQTAWKSEYAAFREWRARVEQLGIAVLALPMGPESSRGFSAWDDRIPVVAINTHWSPTARIFTLFHELGHLVTRTSSVCEESVGQRHKGGEDAVEKWCEAFAAAVLVPWPDLQFFLRNTLNWQPGSRRLGLAAATQVARRYKVSLRAAVLRMISHDAADWSTYKSIPPRSEYKAGGGGGEGRTRPQARLDEYGKRTASILMRGLHREVLSRDDVLSYLNITDRELGEFEASALPM